MNLARKLRKSQTNAEERLWYFLRDRQLSKFKFRRQHPIGPYIADFCCLEKRLIVELDGGQHVKQQLQDQIRTQYLNHEGYQVIRFWDHDVLKKTNDVLKTIQVALENPLPSPLPERERGLVFTS